MDFTDFLKILELYKLKTVARDSSNDYDDAKDGVRYERRETTAEHIYSALRLADYFLTTEPEFEAVDRARAYELIMYHDDSEILTGDTGIASPDRAAKERYEAAMVPEVAKRLPEGLEAKLLDRDREFRELATPEARFANAVDKLDGMIHELQYPEDWGPRGFDEAKVRRLFQAAFEYSPTFMRYFEATVDFLRDNGYFEREQPATLNRVLVS